MERVGPQGPRYGRPAMPKRYQPYEIKPFLSSKSFLRFLDSDLVARCLTSLCGDDGYNKIVKWFSERQSTMMFRLLGNQLV
jgi:hypothetical protein